MKAFKVEGPFVIPVYCGVGGRAVRTAEGREFFDTHPHLKKQTGCYVFAMRSGRGVVPYYVGIATKSFGQECFSHHKLNRCHEILTDYAKGTLVAFFVIAPAGPGRPSTAHLRSLEKYLIHTAMTRNPHLLNVKNTKTEEWSIAGVLRSRQGVPSKAAKAFKSAMRI